MTIRRDFVESTLRCCDRNKSLWLESNFEYQSDTI